MKLKPNGYFFSLFVVSGLLLSGCGGGDGGGSATPAVKPVVITASAEGVYAGSLTGSRSTAFQMLVLENDEFYALYGTSTASVFAVAGFIQGQGVSSNGKFTSASAKDFGSSPASAGTVNATYDPSLKTAVGTFTASAGTVSFSGAPIAGSLYNYSTPASLATVTGFWTATGLSGEGVAFNVESNGTFNAVSSLGCRFSGTVLPRPSGKNVFNVALTFGAAPCALPGQAASGIALAYPVSGGKTQLLVSVTDSTRTNGTAVFGTR